MKRILTVLTLAASLISVANAEEGKVSIDNLTFATGAPWKAAENASAMRKATLTIEAKGAEKPMEAVFFYFGGGQGGDVDANIQRWVSQFQGAADVKREEVDVGDGVKVTLVKATGTYMDGAMFAEKTPRENWALLGAIVPGKEAPVFIKLTGPKDAALSIYDTFKALATSPFPKK
jgi:hypothetical protein